MSVPKLYWLGSVDSAWETAGNWWKDAEATDPADNAPWVDGTDTTYLAYDLTLANDATNAPQMDVDMSSLSFGLNATGTCDIAGITAWDASTIRGGTFTGDTCSFYGNVRGGTSNGYGCYFNFVYNGTFNGNAASTSGIVYTGTFAGDGFTADNYATILGGTFTGVGFRLLGGSEIVGGTFNPIGFHNEGVVAAGDLFGGYTGSGDNCYFIDGVLTTLDAGGHGDYDGHHYVYGNIFDNGWDSYENWNMWYINGYPEYNIDSNGTGWANSGLRYDGGSPFTGIAADFYGYLALYIDGVAYTTDGWNAEYGVYIANGSVEYGITQEGTGWAVYSAAYFILGVGYYFLDQNGNGQDQDGYYIGGVRPTDGWHPEPVAGFPNGAYWIGHYPNSRLDQTGTGYDLLGYPYLNGVPRPTGWFDWDGYADYWINNEATNLDQNGTGWANVGGVTAYYINVVQTTLNWEGNGTWNGVYYYHGVVQTALYYNNATEDGAWDTLGNWWTDAAFTDPATHYPAEGQDVYLAQTMLTGPSTPVTLNHIYVAHASTGGGTFGVVFTGASGNATFNDGGNNQGVITGTATFNAPDTFNNGHVTGTATFYGQDGNSGTCEGNAFFNDTTTNIGTVTGDSTFSLTAAASQIKFYNGGATQGTFTGSVLVTGGGSQSVINLGQLLGLPPFIQI